MGDEETIDPNVAAVVVSVMTGQVYQTTQGQVSEAIAEANADDKLAELAAIQAALEERQAAKAEAEAGSFPEPVSEDG